MRDAYQVAAVRAAERALMEIVPDGALMARAAAGLASVCASLLARHPGHVYGTRVVVLRGSGDDGGDALPTRRPCWPAAALPSPRSRAALRRTQAASPPCARPAAG